jgi:hypothetical protein
MAEKRSNTMKCPKCTGLLIQEEIQEHSGRFHGWRCIQCGLRLDRTIVQNRHEVQTDAQVPNLAGASVNSSPTPHTRPIGRPKRPAGRA